MCSAGALVMDLPALAAFAMQEILKEGAGRIPSLTIDDPDGDDLFVWISANLNKPPNPEDAEIHLVVYGLLAPDLDAHDTANPVADTTALARPAAAAQEGAEAKSSDCAPSQVSITTAHEDTEMKESTPRPISKGTRRKRNNSTVEIHVTSANVKKPKLSHPTVLPLMDASMIDDLMSEGSAGHGCPNAIGDAGLFKPAAPPQNASKKQDKSRKGLNRTVQPEPGTSAGSQLAPLSPSSSASPSQSSITDDAPEYINGKCSICNTAFKTDWDFDRHVDSRIHTKVSQKAVGCPICGDKSGRPDNIDQHIILLHTIRDPKCKSRGKCHGCSHVGGPADMRKHLKANPNCFDAAVNAHLSKLSS